jgi:hypothetical protein
MKCLHDAQLKLQIWLQQHQQLLVDGQWHPEVNINHKQNHHENWLLTRNKNEFCSLKIKGIRKKSATSMHASIKDEI